MVGIDEVGRGAWAGPLLVCAARLHKSLKGLTDSKLLSAKKREQLAQEIIGKADVGFGWVTAKEIDSIGLAAALRLGAERAITEIAVMPTEKVVIDGTINFLPGYNVTTKVKADMTVPAVSAASIAAKVARDALMHTLTVQYPLYSFEKNVGYGTAQHRLALKKYGLCPEHRSSFSIHKYL